MKLPQWGIFRKLDLSRTEDKLKLGILTTGILLFAVIGAAGALRLTMSPSFCVKCHVMTPEYVTWQASSHVQIPCTSCHIKPGLGNLVAHKISAGRELLLYYTGTYSRPIKMRHKLPDEVCTQCHSTYRSYTPSGDLIIPHDKHAEKKVLCVECHSGVAHGNIVARGMTKDDNYTAWTDEVGKKQMAKDYTEPKMNDCLDCHIKRNVTQACEACHTSISLPADHKVKTWDKNHGAVAKTDLGYCNKCHSYSLEAKDVPVSDKVARYARGNVFCYDCHQKRPKGHTADWRIIHPVDAKPDIPGCLVCHNKAKPKPAEKATPTYCDRCHGRGGDASVPGVTRSSETPSVNSGGNTFRFEKSHDPGWRNQHPEFIKTQGIVRGKCFSCHDTSNCSYCHTKTSAAKAKQPQPSEPKTVTNAGYSP
jgi:cytochrome c nitrite reductase small subunit